MRFLLIAHDFPPIPSPQSLRWAYLVGELFRQGHEIHVLAPDHPGYGPLGGMPEVPAGVNVHRTFPGLFTWSIMAQARAKKRGRPLTTACADAAAAEGAMTEQTHDVRSPALNWKGRAVEWLKAAYARRLFPDVRAEWNPWARRAFKPLLAQICPDVVIASHEPPGTLSLALMAKRLGYCIVADLGDPVCATYTPPGWRARAMALERQVCAESDLVVVTSEATRALLEHRHGISRSRIQVVTQGFDASFVDFNGESRRAGDQLELVYTGSFYDFRSPDQLVAAIMATPGVRLSVASSSVPESLQAAARERPDRIRLLGFQPHRRALSLQRWADVLVNIANTDPAQVPGKVYEYLGAHRPILHIGANLADEAAVLIRELEVGWVVNESVQDIGSMLSELCSRREQIRAQASLRDATLVGKYAWSALASQLATRIHVASGAQKTEISDMKPTQDGVEDAG